MKFLISALFLLSSPLSFAQAFPACAGNWINVGPGNCSAFNNAAFGLTVVTHNTGGANHCCITCANSFTVTPPETCAPPVGVSYPSANSFKNNHDKCCKRNAVAVAVAVTRPVCPPGTTWDFVTGPSQCSTAPGAIPMQTYAGPPVQYRCCKIP